MLGFHIDEYPDWTQWDQESRTRASTLIASMGNFQLIITLTIMVNILDIIKGPTIKIQGRSLDLYDVVKQVEAAKLHLKCKRHDPTPCPNHAMYNRSFKYAKDLAALVNAEPTMPRTVGRQRHRANAPADIPSEYWLRNVYLPFLDHILVGIDSRFDKFVVHRMADLIPSIIVTRDDFDFKEVLNIYSDDVPSPNRSEEEFIRWRREWLLADESVRRPDSIAKALKACDFHSFPNIYTLLQIYGTIAVTSCECERSGMVLKRLNAYLRASMGQERMSGLAFLHINHDVYINRQVCKEEEPNPHFS